MTDHMTTRQKQIPNRIFVLLSPPGDMSIDSQGAPLNGGKGDIHVEYARVEKVVSDEELVKRLRNKTRDSILKENDRVEAADRIEQLKLERDVLLKGWTENCAELYRVDVDNEALIIENKRLRDALFAWIDMMNDPSTKLRRKVVEFYSIAIAALR